MLVVLGVAAALAVWAGIAASWQTDDFANLPAAPAGDDDTAGLDDATAWDEVADDPTREAPDRASRGAQRAALAFARVDDVELALPSPEVDRVGFAEARRGTAQPLVPFGTLVDNANADKFVPGDDSAGPAYHVLASRGEPWPATSSASLVVPRRTPVRSPVDGEVTEVARYPMADGATDVRVRIVPDGAPAIAVELRHLSDVDVDVGQQVDAAATPLGIVRSVALTHPADAITADDQAHLRVEVRPARAPAAPDPNAPAEEDAGA